MLAVSRVDPSELLHHLFPREQSQSLTLRVSGHSSSFLTQQAAIDRALDGGWVLLHAYLRRAPNTQNYIKRDMVEEAST